MGSRGAKSANKFGGKNCVMMNPRVPFPEFYGRVQNSNEGSQQTLIYSSGSDAILILEREPGGNQQSRRRRPRMLHLWCLP